MIMLPAQHAASAGISNIPRPSFKLQAARMTLAMARAAKYVAEVARAAVLRPASQLRSRLSVVRRRPASSPPTSPNTCATTLMEPDPGPGEARASTRSTWESVHSVVGCQRSSDLLTVTKVPRNTSFSRRTSLPWITVAGRLARSLLVNTRYMTGHT